MKFEPKRNNLIKNLLNFIILVSFVLGAIDFLIVKNYFRAFIYIVITPPLLLLPRLLYLKILCRIYRYSLLNMLESFAIAIFVSVSVGSWWLFASPYEYDTLCHFFIPMLIAIMLTFAIEIFNSAQNKEKHLNFFIFVFILTAIFGVLWEFFEFGVDNFLDTMLFNGHNQSIFADTLTDIIADIFGAFAGSLIVYFKWPKWQKEWRNDRI